jgi:hypothetical protein
MMGKDQDADSRLTSFVRDPQTDPWYRCIGETLLGEKTESELILGTTERPSDALTAYTAMGFWAEGNNQTTKAVKYYKEALGSYLDHRLEYGFVRERLRRLQIRMNTSSLSQLLTHPHGQGVNDIGGEVADNGYVIQ